MLFRNATGNLLRNNDVVSDALEIDVQGMTCFNNDSDPEFQPAC